jgi:hypothetical protein
MGSDVRAYAAKTQTINFWLVRRATLSLLSMSWLTVALLSLTSATALSQITSSQITVSQTTGAATPEASGTTLLRPTLKPGSRGSEVTELASNLKTVGLLRWHSQWSLWTDYRFGCFSVSTSRWLKCRWYYGASNVESTLSRRSGDSGCCPHCPGSNCQ